MILQLIYLSCETTHSSIHLTRLYAAGFGTQVGQVDVGLPAIDYGVGILAGSLRCSSVCHRHLITEPDCQQGLRRQKKKKEIIVSCNKQTVAWHPWLVTH